MPGFRNVFIVFVAFCAIHTTQAVAAPTLVYDALKEQGPTGGQGLGFYLTEIGQTITLAGSEREIVSFETGFIYNTDVKFQLKFYNVEGPFLIPTTEFWTSPVYTIDWDPPHANRENFRIDVPNVVVPDTFAWAVAYAGGSSDGYYSLRTGEEPTVGERQLAWARITEESVSSYIGWEVGDMAYNQFQVPFAAKFLAVPTPSTTSILIASALALISRMRRESLGRATLGS